jgi:hypothetical protein
MGCELCLKTECQDLFSNVGGSQKRISQRDGRQRDRLVVVIVVIMIMITTLNTLAGYSNNIRTQVTSKLTSPSAFQFM